MTGPVTGVVAHRVGVPTLILRRVELGLSVKRETTCPGTKLSNREKNGMDQFVWDVPAWVVCPGEGVG
jgi:hypothetical protein